MQSTVLLQELLEASRILLNKAVLLQQLDEAALNRRPAPESWSILECVEHLNRYSDYYIPVMDAAMNTAKPGSVSTFSPGWLGDYFAKLMRPKEKLNKIKTFADKNPIHQPLDRKVIAHFIEQQHQLIRLLDKAAQYDLNRIRIPITLSRFIRLKLGDTFRFVIYHQQRHMEQIERIHKL